MCKKKQISTNIHAKLFYTNLALRDSCYKCEYASMNRLGDFTIGDAWGVKEYNPEFFHPDGVSLCLINSEKSLELFEKLKPSVFYQEVELKTYKQHNMVTPSAPHRSVDEFWKDYDSRSFLYIVKKYAENNIILNASYIIKNFKNLFLRKFKKES